jgi:hypothetical protein
MNRKMIGEVSLDSFSTILVALKWTVLPLWDLKRL